eukprot:TRINITY_DN1679_c0_g1_i1.p1 TRINITY_DN1679_c0_g1~~TRINITY_DN1679_c0_g1_i1.p1  ORF type:complete len:488 (-),score=149.58 TRINITY_DN1679_c0_g1_i1:357-1820(-)
MKFSQVLLLAFALAVVFGEARNVCRDCLTKGYQCADTYDQCYVKTRNQCPAATIDCTETPTTSPAPSTPVPSHTPTTAPPSPVPTSPAPPTSDFKYAVYTTEWAQYYKTRPTQWCVPYGNTPAHLTASLYTHVLYAFARIDRDTSTVMTVEYNAESVLIPQAVGLKKENPNLKVIVSIGGWSFSTSTGAFAPGSTYGDQDAKYIFPNVTLDATKRATFIASAVQFCEKWGFDGIDIDWEWPSNEQERTGFTTLLMDLRAATSAKGLLLTTALRGSPTAGFDNYELTKIHPYVDFINLMTYDYHGGAWETNVPVQVHTPILDCKNNTNFDITGAVNHYLSQGVPASKINMGLATYGRTFKVGSATDSLGADSLGAGVIGACTLEVGLLAYFEIERALNNVFHEEDKQLMAAYGTFKSTSTGPQYNVVTFDTANTHRLKMCWLRARGLGGVMIWDGESDDNQMLLSKIRSQIDDPQCSDFKMPSCTAKE